MDVYFMEKYNVGMQTKLKLELFIDFATNRKTYKRNLLFVIDFRIVMLQTN